MTTVHARIVGDEAVVPRVELDRLVELARRSEKVDVAVEADEVPTVGLMRLAEDAGAFDWLADDEDLYTIHDLKVRYG